MLDLFNIAKPQGCDIQTFYGAGPGGSGDTVYSWVKPRGVSHVYMLLIGAGGDGNGTSGGGSGGVTVWYGAAQNVPDRLTLRPSAASGSGGCRVQYLNGTATVNLVAAGEGSTSSAASAVAANQFAASGFYQSIAGQAGVVGGSTASATTFLSGGGASGATSANYGYSAPCGYFQMQPIIVGVGGGGSGALVGQGGVGCGGGYLGKGGPGMILIASW